MNSQTVVYEPQTISSIARHQLSSLITLRRSSNQYRNLWRSAERRFVRYEIFSCSRSGLGRWNRTWCLFFRGQNETSGMIKVREIAGLLHGLLRVYMFPRIDFRLKSRSKSFLISKITRFICRAGPLYCLKTWIFLRKEGLLAVCTVIRSFCRFFGAGRALISFCGDLLGILIFREQYGRFWVRFQWNFPPKFPQILADFLPILTNHLH